MGPICMKKKKKKKEKKPQLICSLLSTSACGKRIGLADAFAKVIGIRVYSRLNLDFLHT